MTGIPISCKYTNPTKQCAEAEWVAALMCDHCDADGTMDLCDDHYHRYFVDQSIRLACGDCKTGSVSYVAERIDHSAQQEVIN